MKVLQLIRIDFDNNKDSTIEDSTTLAFFPAGDSDNILELVDNFFKTYNAGPTYMGWDSKVFPQYVIEYKELK